MSNKTLIWGSVFVVAGLLIFARLYSNGNSSTASIHNSASVRASLRNGANTGAPDFTLQKLGGGTINLSKFRGKKSVIVDFWASWCPNCRRDMPNLNRFYEKYKDRVEVIGVNLRERESTVRDFIESRGISFPIALDPSGQVSNAFGVQYTNTHVLIDKDGSFVRTIPGDIKESDIQLLLNYS